MTRSLTKIAALLIPLSLSVANAAEELPENPVALAQITCRLRARVTHADRLKTEVTRVAAGREPAQIAELRRKLGNAQTELRRLETRANAKYQTLTSSKVTSDVCRQLQAGTFPGQAESSRWWSMKTSDIQNQVCQKELQLQYQAVLQQRFGKILATEKVNTTDVDRLLQAGIEESRADFQSDINLGKRVYLSKTGNPFGKCSR